MTKYYVTLPCGKVIENRSTTMDQAAEYVAKVYNVEEGESLSVRHTYLVSENTEIRYYAIHYIKVPKAMEHREITGEDMVNALNGKSVSVKVGS